MGPGVAGRDLDGPPGRLAALLVGAELVLRATGPHVAVEERDLGERQQVVHARVRLGGLGDQGPERVDARRVLVVAVGEGPDLGGERGLGGRGSRGAQEHHDRRRRAHRARC